MFIINGEMVVFNQAAPASDNIFQMPVLVCLLGEFRILKAGRPVFINSGGKAETLFKYLGLYTHNRVPRHLILETVWPDHDPVLASQSLNSLTHSLRKWLSDELNGEGPIVYKDGYYRLNTEAGVSVDVTSFEALVKMGDQHAFANRLPNAIPFYTQAILLYRGDLCAGVDINAVMVRERLRVQFLTALAHLADYHFSINEYGRCFHYTNRLLENDPCREDAHRLAMRSYVRQGQRAQALRQYRLCVDILRSEFDAAPEQLTSQLYDQIRLSPDTI